MDGLNRGVPRCAAGPKTDAPKQVPPPGPTWSGDARAVQKTLRFLVTAPVQGEAGREAVSRFWRPAAVTEL